MKTPKRTYTTCFLEWGDEFSGRLSSGQQRAYARWHRKNRIKQLKRTIARLRRENFHMKIDLNIPVNISYDEYHSRRVDFTERTPEPYIELT